MATNGGGASKLPETAQNRKKYEKKTKIPKANPSSGSKPARNVRGPKDHISISILQHTGAFVDYSTRNIDKDPGSHDFWFPPYFRALGPECEILMSM